MTSPDGITWTARTAQTNYWSSVCYGNGLFVAVSNNVDEYTQIMTSPDGINWTFRNSPQTNPWQAVTYGNGLFVAVAGSGITRVMTSSDGITWTARSAAENNSWKSVCYGNGLFVAVAPSGTNRIMTSSDGITWTSGAVEANEWQSVTYGNGMFVAVASTGSNNIITSSDGINWTGRTGLYALTSVCYGNGLFVATANGNLVRVSTDGMQWTTQQSMANNWSSICYGNGSFVAVANAATYRVMTAQSWIDLKTPITANTLAETAFQRRAWSGTTTQEILLSKEKNYLCYLFVGWSNSGVGGYRRFLLKNGQLTLEYTIGVSTVITYDPITQILSFGSAGGSSANSRFEYIEIP